MKLSKWIIAFLVLMLAGGTAYADSTDFMDRSLTYDQTYTRDVDGNGVEELTFHMQEDALVLSVWDVDENGLADRWFAYGGDDVLELEGNDTDLDGEADTFFSIDADGSATPVKGGKGLPLVPIALAGGAALAVAALFGGIKRAFSASALLLACMVALSAIAPSYADSVLNDDCSVNDSVFDRDWVKYSDIDARIELISRSPEAQKIQAVSDELRFHYTALFLAQRDLEIEKAQRQELKTIKDLLVRNIKNNLLKAFMRLTYVTYDTIQGTWHGTKGSVETVLDKSSAGVQMLTSYIKLHKSLSPPSKTASQTKGVMDRAEGIANSTVLEYFDTAGNPKKIAVNLINDLQKEAFDIVKTNDEWKDAKLTDDDFKLLRNEYLRNRDLDVAIQESDLVCSQLREMAEEHTLAIKALEQEYLGLLVQEKARVRDLLVMACERDKEDAGEGDEPTDDAPVPVPSEPTPLPQGGIPTAAQISGTYTLQTDATLYAGGQTQRASSVSAGSITAQGDRELLFSDFTDESNLTASYNPDSGYFSTTRSVEGVTYRLKGKAIIENGKIRIDMTIDGDAQGARFLFDIVAEKTAKAPELTAAPSKRELVGLYQMSMTVTTVNNGKTETFSDVVEASVSLVNGQVAFADTASAYAGMALDYDEATGVLSYDYLDDEVSLSIRGTAVRSDGTIQIDLATTQVEENYRFEGSYSLRKFQ